MKPPARQVMSVAELAEYLGLCPSTIYRMLKRGRLEGTYFKTASDYRFNVEAIDRWRLNGGRL